MLYRTAPLTASWCYGIFHPNPPSPKLLVIYNFTSRQGGGAPISALAQPIPFWEEPAVDVLDYSAEIWKDVVGYENLYQVSNFGRVKSIGASPYRSANLIMKPFRDVKNGGYCYVKLYGMSGIFKRRSVHSLVCEAFHGPRPLHHEANHIDGVKYNNRSSNLEWTTKSGNSIHAKSIGLIHFYDRKYPVRKGEDNNHVILTEVRVKEIRSIPKGVPIKDIAVVFGVTPVTIHKIRSRKLWKHI